VSVCEIRGPVLFEEKFLPLCQINPAHIIIQGINRGRENVGQFVLFVIIEK
jgi:hypothetical protein